MKKILKVFLSVLPYIILLFLSCFLIANKDDMFLDEVYSYCLANSSLNFFENNIKYESALDFVNSVLTVDTLERFNFSNVIKNNASDSNGPLYYLLLHFVSSFFPEKFSFFFAGSINILSVLLSLFFLRKLVNILTLNNKLILNIISYSFIFSVAILNAILLLRMYALAMFWVILVSYIIVKEFQEEKNDLKFYILWFIVVLFSSLTHYYCLLFNILISCVYSLFLVIRKKWKSFFVFSSATFLYFLAFCSLFHFLFFSHMISTPMQQTIINFNNLNLSAFLNRFFIFFFIINVELFASFLIGAIILTLIFVIILKSIEHFLKLQPQMSSVSNIQKYQFLLIFIPIALYFILVSQLAPFFADRYLMPIYGLVFASISFIIYFSLNKVINKKIVAIFFCVLAFLITLRGLYSCNWFYGLPYLSKKPELIEQFKQYSDIDALVVFDNKVNVNETFIEIENFRSVTFVDISELDNFNNLEVAKQNKLIVIVLTQKDSQAVINFILKESLKLSKFKQFDANYPCLIPIKIKYYLLY